MGDNMINLITVIVVIIALVLGTIFIAVPLFAGIGAAIGAVFRGIGWLLAHITGFVIGMARDAVRLLGACVAWVVFIPFLLINIVIGRWSASGHYFRSMKRECQIASSCVYRLLLRRPLRFLLLGGLLEGIEDRLDEAVAAAPGADKPTSRAGKYEGYKIIGSLPVGGSGAKLYIAEPDAEKRERNSQLPAKVVIKAFALTDGSSLPQIVRESRALEAAKQLGLVLDHGMDEQRFFYVMPYHDGDHLSIVARQLHAESDGDGLARRQLGVAMRYVEDLLLTLREYHRAGLWHKDVKPENVIVHDDRAHLVDLGLVTPLRSAMTLTTHGTEYFRDPEMVRQALRGVKVHQVDGTKFDIYAVGAVMYFMLENTFPAHGGLSRFGRRSPESLRWIVRRAMTEYHQRYSGVDIMLADIRHVMASSDPFAVKPAELPSMKGGATQVDAAHAAEMASAGDADAMHAGGGSVAAAAAGSPSPPASDVRKKTVAIGGMGVSAGIGSKGPFVQVGKLSLDENGEPVWNEGKPSTVKPNLRVTSWWTGAYVAGDPLTIEAPAKAHGAHAVAAAPQQKATLVPASSRRPASEQIAAAQARANERSRRAAERRAKFAVGKTTARHAHARREPSAIVGLLVVAALITGAVMMFQSFRDEQRGSALALDGVVVSDVPGGAAHTLPTLEELDQLVAELDMPLPILVINDHPAKANPTVQARIAAYMSERVSAGWSFSSDDLETEARVRQLLPTGDIAASTISDTLHDLLDGEQLGGVVIFSASKGEEPAQDRILATWVFNPMAIDEHVRSVSHQLQPADLSLVTPGVPTAPSAQTPVVTQPTSPRTPRG